MFPYTKQFGIYFNKDDSTIVRITSPYWLPEEPQWVYVTDKVNATLLEVRAIIKQKKLMSNVEAITWGHIPQK